VKAVVRGECRVEGGRGYSGRCCMYVRYILYVMVMVMVMMSGEDYEAD